jgi:ABC-type sugar transport system ATPase subunit
MAEVRARKVAKHFRAKNTLVEAVKETDVDIRDGEFAVFVGPSGSGKTTFLRMVAGLELPTSGQIFIGEREVTTMHPRARGVAMVFQDYALYPHMTVRQNMGFALENLRYPRQEIKHLQEEVDTTTVYVTHDQVEAMTMGDRVAVMNEGVLEQVGAPFDVYQHPANVFVGFIGSPAMSFARVSAVRSDGMVTLRGDELSVSTSVPTSNALPSEILLGIRPEHAHLWRGDAGLVGPLAGRVVFVEKLGRETLVGVDVGPGSRFTLIAPPNAAVAPGDRVELGVEPGRLYAFDVETERALGAI